MKNILANKFMFSAACVIWLGICGWLLFLGHKWNQESIEMADYLGHDTSY